MNSIETKLHVEIDDDLDKLYKMEKGGDKHRAAVGVTTQLLDRAIELEKLDLEARKIDNEAKKIDNEAKKIEAELLKAQQQMDDDRKDRLIKNCITAAGIAIPTLVTIWGTIKTIEFEKTGTVTTIIGRGFFGKLLPKK